MLPCSPVHPYPCWRCWEKYKVEVVTPHMGNGVMKQHPGLSLSINGPVGLRKTLVSAAEAEIAFWVVSTKRKFP